MQPYVLTMEKWKRISNSSREIVSEDWHDAMTEHFKDQDSTDADLFFRYLVTIPNPNRVGIYDSHIAYLKLANEYSPL